MKKINYLLIVLALSMAGCNNSSAEKKENKSGEAISAAAESSNTPEAKEADPAKPAGNGWERLVMVASRDQQGQVVAETPYPASWNIITRHAQGEPSIIGPNGIKVIDFNLQSYMYTNDPRMQQIYYQSGQQLRALPSLEQFIQQDIVPRAAARGMQLVRYAEVPEVTKVDKWYMDQLYKAVPSQGDNKAIGVDFTKADGSPYFLLIHLNYSNSAELQNWSYYCSGLEADKGAFEGAKKQLIFSLANTHYPLEPIAAYNRREAEKAGQSWAAHNQRMAQNQASFEASQRAHVNKTNAINDAIMSGYRSRDAASDRNQDQFLNVITERTNVTNTSTGQNYKVSSGYNQYWMNSSGEYISSNRNDYNPNLDDNMNNQKWEELKEVK